MFGSLGNIMGLLGNLGKITKDQQEITAQLREKRIEASAGGDMVRVAVNGVSEVLEVRISPELVKTGDVEMIEDLVASAISSALDQARVTAQEQMAKLLEGLPLGPLKGLLDQIKPKPAAK